MIESGQRYVVMGLLNTHSLAYAIGQRIRGCGGLVTFTVQNETLRRRYLGGEEAAAALAGFDVRLCDVTVEDEVRSLFEAVGPVAGVVHSLAYANPKTCLGPEFHTDALEDIQRSYHVTCVSLATVARYAVPRMPAGGAIVALSFDTRHVYPHYNWMGVHKAALEALVRHLARRHGRDRVRVNAVSAGPLATTASAKIPDFETIADIWRQASPLPWDPVADRHAVADAVAFLVGPCAAKISGQVLAVDGGASLIAGSLLPGERMADHHA
jgi:enoyl-[acyl-carrier protein] reductase I